VKARGRKSADEALAAALAAGQTIESAAVAAHVSESTAYRRMKDDAFRARVAEIRKQFIGTAAAKLTGTMTEAVDVLRELLKSEADSIRLRSAIAIIEQSVRLTELHELQEQVAELERRLKGANL
jgi:hypothetical protein